MLSRKSDVCCLIDTTIVRYEKGATVCWSRDSNEVDSLEALDVHMFYWLVDDTFHKTVMRFIAQFVNWNNKR